jgi:membrane-bound metal-dependent hydrolase YbcI (DUF457 family)
MSPLGHLAIGFAAKPIAPIAPLWALLLASEVPDLLFLGLEAAGIEYQAITQTDLNQGLQIINPGSNPWSHGLFMTAVWSILIAGIAFFFFRNRRTSIVLGLMLLSHWVLDFLVHPPELPLLFDGSPLVGLGLWSSGFGLIISVILEIVLLAVGIAIYLRTRKRKSETATV